MSAPRRILPGLSYLITRRCWRRTFRLRPSARTNQIFLYCLAIAAKKTGVMVHAACVMSNHHHLVVTDVEGKLPDFLRELHRMTAKALNALHGLWENLWSGEPTNVVLLSEGEDVLRKMAYVVANPVDAGLVPQPEQWPGVLLWGARTIRVRRPGEYFDPEGDSDEWVELVVSPPRVAQGIDGWGDRFEAQVRRLVEEAHRTMHEEGARFLGRAAVLAAAFADRATSYEIKRGIVPRIAAIRRDVRKAMVRMYRSFHEAYASALTAWRAGDRGVAFPAGTWWFRVHHGAAVAAA